MRVFVLENDALIADRRIAEGPIIIGSAPDCTISLPDAHVARRQVQLNSVGGGDWTVEVLDTVQATVVNGVVLSQRQRLKDRDELQLGRYVLKCYLTMEGSGSLTRASAAAPAARRDEYVLPTGGFVRMPSTPLQLTLTTLQECTAFSCELSTAIDIEAVVDRTLRRAIAAFHGSAACACIRQRTATALEMVRAIDAKARPIDPPALVAKLHERCTRQLYRVCLPDASAHGVGSVMAAPIVGSRSAVLGMLYVESPEAGMRFDGDQLDQFSTLAGLVAGPLERLIAGATAARAEVVDREQIIARLVQDALTPRAIPEWPDVRFAALRRNGSARARDIYDVLRLANRTVAMLVARFDAVGAMLPRLMAETRAAFRTACLHADAPHVLARAVNWLIQDGGPQWSIELGCTWIMPTSGVVKYCIAGNAIGLGRISAGGELHHFEPCRMPAIGRERGFAYGSLTEKLEVNDMLAMMSDGADAMKSADGTAFGRSRIWECLADTAGLAPNLMLADLSKELDDFAAGGEAPDDVSVLLASRLQ